MVRINLKKCRHDMQLKNAFRIPIRARLCHWCTPFVRSNYPSMINRIVCICYYTKHCHYMMNSALVAVIRKALSLF